MKKIFAIVLVTVFCIFAAAVAYAAGPAVLKNVKVSMNGNAAVYKTVLNSKSHILVNTADFLKDLDKANGSDKITWTSAGKTVTIKIQGLELQMTAGKNTAKANGKNETLTAAPAWYANKLYIPAEYAAAKLGFKCVYSAEANTVFVRDAASFAEIKKIAAASKKAEESAMKYAMDMDMQVGVADKAMNVNMKLLAEMKVDKAKKREYTKINMDMVFMKMDSEEYYIDPVKYTKDSFTGTWTKSELTPLESKTYFSDNENSVDMDFESDLVCMNLFLDKKASPDEYILKGNTYLESMMKKSGDMVGEGSMKVDSSKLELVIDKNTMLTKSLDMSFSGSVTSKGQTQKMNVSLKAEIKDINGDFEITVPEEVIKAAKAS